MLEHDNIHSFFFLGIGGIGMSALARYFHSRGYHVSGYDRTPSPLTAELEAEGIAVTYDGEVLPAELALTPQHTQVVYTPAVPRDLPLFVALREAGFDIVKRSEMLGLVTRQQQALCVAGTHGKTTTSTLIAHLMHTSHRGCSAFLGGISNNYHSNLLIDPQSDFVAVEADEYDRSFHRLTPYISVITSVDPDHLDIYGTPEAYREAFEHYSSLITHALVIKADLPITPRLQAGVKAYTYGKRGADYYADHILCRSGEITFDLVTPEGTIAGLHLGAPVWINIENSVAAMAVALLCGASEEEIRTGLESFAGVYRRFDRHVKNNHVVYYDDYAHHPEELRASIASISRLYPSRTLIGVFQPHLYTRTRDFATEFASVLNQLDEVILLPIYPARELPIRGVNSEMLRDEMLRQREMRDTINRTVSIVEKVDLVDTLRQRVTRSNESIALITLGAGDIDRLVPEIRDMLCSL